MTTSTVTAPPLKNPDGFRGGHRLWTAGNGRPFDSFKPYGYGEGHALVTVTDWCTSYTVDGRQGATLNVYRAHANGRTIEHHELSGTNHIDALAARRCAWDAGLLAFMVYERRA